ncbi:hypothetical protein BDF21DRAFT_431052 [Thamnidium elegans]|uniref:Uncharacterized protein n=1 Tax=Thamnidium elegans TaxID=101142 RepID=A0A8H7SXW6_9FUNG|nr:hypothetical protein INT48_008368 [Thamnidium elegans]KAI8054785.1 hypothetical protein BDF21DRAFT_431052 [Thamnidium elegans]
MGVQDVVARLNKSKSATTVTKRSIIPPVPKRKIAPTIENKMFPPSPVDTPTSFIHQKDHNISPLLNKFNQPPTRPIITTATPPESPVKSQQFDYNQFDTTASEIVDIFQTLLDQNKSAQETINKLKQDVEKYSSDSTKVRDYEIRVEYLALKLEQVSEERDYYEKELEQNIQQQQKQQNIQKQQRQSDIVLEDEQKLHEENNNAYMEDILNVYEEISDQSEDEGDELQLFDQDSSTQPNQLNQQDCDRGIQMTIMKYVTDLETQRLEVKALKQVVKKQDELITKLEIKLSIESSDELLQEQVQLQKIELDNKRELLSQLLNEREDLLRRINTSNHRRSSIDMISNIMISNNKRPDSYSSISSSGRGTPPLTAPPRQPLPPLPK